MKIIEYGQLLLKYENLKREDVKHLKKIKRLEVEKQILSQCLTGEGKRVETFRGAYKKSINDYEDLMNEYKKLEKENSSLKRKIKKLEKEKTNE